MQEKSNNTIPQWPYTVKGWGEKLIARFEVEDVILLEAFFKSGMVDDAIEYYKNHRVGIPFDNFWEEYAYKKGNKAVTQKYWDKLTQDKQRWILEVAIPKYRRYINVSGISKCQPLVWLRGKRYNDEIPDETRIEQFARRVEKYMEVLEWERKYPQYKTTKPSFPSIVNAAEAFMYRYPDKSELDVCGILKWMVSTWGNEYKHLVSPVRAMSLNKFTTYWINAEKEITKLKNDRAKKDDRKVLEETE